jgi:hypothetical protein
LHRLEIFASQYLTTQCWLCCWLPIALGCQCQGWYRLILYCYGIDIKREGGTCWFGGTRVVKKLWNIA